MTNTCRCWPKQVLVAQKFPYQSLVQGLQVGALIKDLQNFDHLQKTAILVMHYASRQSSWFRKVANRKVCIMRYLPEEKWPRLPSYMKVCSTSALPTIAYTLCRNKRTAIYNEQPDITQWISFKDLPAVYCTVPVSGVQHVRDWRVSSRAVCWGCQEMLVLIMAEC